MFGGSVTVIVLGGAVLAGLHRYDPRMCDVGRSNERLRRHHYPCVTFQSGINPFAHKSRVCFANPLVFVGPRIACHCDDISPYRTAVIIIVSFTLSFTFIRDIPMARLKTAQPNSSLRKIAVVVIQRLAHMPICTGGDFSRKKKPYRNRGTFLPRRKKRTGTGSRPSPRSVFRHLHQN